jgi:hypothetical protein
MLGRPEHRDEPHPVAMLLASSAIAALILRAELCVQRKSTLKGLSLAMLRYVEFEEVRLRALPRDAARARKQGEREVQRYARLRFSWVCGAHSVAHPSP